MLCSKFFSGLAASLTLCCLIGSGLKADAQYFQAAPAGKSPFGGDRERIIAHHECCTTAPLAADILATDKGGSLREPLSDSLWGNLILQMAFARDKHLALTDRKMRLTDNLTLAGIYGISALGLAQGITSLSLPNNTHALTLSSSRASMAAADTGGMEGVSGGVHDHGQEQSTHDNHSGSTAPSIMSTVASASTLLTLGLRAYYGRRYSKQLRRRQQEIAKQVEAVLSQLEAGQETESVVSDLASLIGQRATREFLQIWRASHKAV